MTLPKITCGIDWAQDHHDSAVVNSDGQVVAKRRIPESVAGFAELTAMLADAGDGPDDPVPVAIETPRGLLVAVLRASGRPIYPINPQLKAAAPRINPPRPLTATNRSDPQWSITPPLNTANHSTKTHGSVRRALKLKTTLNALVSRAINSFH
jgi:hypothetical protein